MRRTRYAVAVAAVLALGLLSVRLAVAADGPEKKAPAANAWDDGGPMPGGLHGQVAQRGPDGFGPPGPPRDGDDDRMPPRGQGRGPQADRGEPMGPPPDGGDGRPMGRHDKRQGAGDRQPMGPDGRRGPDGDRGQPPMGPDGKRGPDGDRGRPMGPHDGGPGCPDGRGRPDGMPGPRPDGIPAPGMGVPGGGMGPGGGAGMGPGHAGMFGSLEKNDPELYALIKKDMDLERQTRDLVKQYREASKDEREKVKAQLDEVVGKHFDARQQKRTLELKRMEQKLQELRDNVDKRSKARKEIIEKRVADLTGHGEDLGF